MEWRGKDGKWYDNYIDRQAADMAWDKQRREQAEQKELLEKQNRILAENAREERIALKQKMEHDELMRILGLFDAVGLNKDYYDRFVKYLTGKACEVLKNWENEDEDFKYDQRKQQEYLNEIKGILNDKSRLEEAPKEVLKNCYVDNPDESIQRMKDVLAKYECGFPREGIPQEDLDVLGSKAEVLLKSKMRKNVYKFFLIFWIVAMPIGLVMMVNMSDPWDGFGFIMAIVGLGMIVFNIVKLGGNVSVRDELERLNSQLKVLDKTKARKNLEEYYKKGLEEYKAKDEKHNAKKKKAFEDVEAKWKNFVDFRMEHYNAQLEKLFLDVGLKNEVEPFGLDYPKINKNNKKGDGTVEDYIAYFDDVLE